MYLYKYFTSLGQQDFLKDIISFSFSQTVSGMMQLMGINEAAGGESNIQVLPHDSLCPWERKLICLLAIHSHPNPL